MKERSFTKDLTLLILGQLTSLFGNIILRTGIVYVYTGSDWFSRYICRHTLRRDDPHDPSITAWRHLSG